MTSHLFHYNILCTSRCCNDRVTLELLFPLSSPQCYHFPASKLLLPHTLQYHHWLCHTCRESPFQSYPGEGTEEQSFHIRRLICGCFCYFTQMTPRNDLTELTSPKSRRTFRKRLWKIPWLVSGRVSLGDISRSAIKTKSLWRWYKNTNIKRKEKIYTFVHELREFSEHNAKRWPVHGVVSQTRVDEIWHLLGGEGRQASFLLVKALFLYKGLINALELVEQCRMVWQLKIK